MSSHPRLLLAYLGNEFPRYAIANLGYLRKTFPEHELWIACDSDAVARKATAAGAQVWKFEVDAELRRRLQRWIGFDPEFRNGFWLNSSLRLWAVLAFAEQFRDAPVLHLEADVWLSPAAPLDEWGSLPCSVAYPIVNGDAAVASVLLVRESQTLRELLSAIDNSDSPEMANDMTLLGRGRRLPGVFVLPTAPNADSCFRADAPLELRQLMSAGVQACGGIIDAATWGQYFLGLDAKNARGKRTLFVDVPDHAIDCKGTSLRVNELGHVFLQGSFGEVAVLAMHVHSKDVRMFRDHAPLLLRRSRHAPDGPAQEFDAVASLSAIAEALRRRKRLLMKRIGRGQRDD